MFAQDEVEFLDEIFAAQQRGDISLLLIYLGIFFQIPRFEELGLEFKQ